MNPYHAEALAGLRDAFGALTPEENDERLLAIALQHSPEDFSEARPVCYECGHRWPCFSFVAATGLYA